MLRLWSGMVAALLWSFPWCFVWSKYSARSCRHRGRAVLHESLLSDSHHSSFLLTIRLPFCPTTAWPCKRPNTLHYNDCKIHLESSDLPHSGLESRNGDADFPPMSCSCLLAFGILLWPAWLQSQYVSPEPPKRHRSSVQKLDTVSTGFPSSWLGLAEYNSLTRHCEHCLSRCY